MRIFFYISLLACLTLSIAGQDPRDLIELDLPFERFSRIYDATEVARGHIKRKEWDRAEAALAKVEKAYPGHSAVLYTRAALNFGQRNYGLAMRDAELVIKSPKDVTPIWLIGRAHLIRAEIFELEGRRVEATNAYKSAIVANNRLETVYPKLEKLLSPDEFLALLNQIDANTKGKRFELSGFFYFARSRIHGGAGRDSLAAKDLEEALWREPSLETPAIWNWLARHYSNDVNAYIRLLTNNLSERALFKPQGNFVFVLSERATAFLSTGAYQEALEDLDKAAKHSGMEPIKSDVSARVFVLRAQTHAALNNLGLALTDAEKVIASGILQKYAYQVRAAVNCRLGKKPEAVADEIKARGLGATIATPCK